MQLLIVFILVIILVVMAARNAGKKSDAEKKIENDWFKKLGYRNRHGTFIGSYITGHPKRSSKAEAVILKFKDRKLQFFAKELLYYDAKRPLYFEIPVEDIASIDVLDESTMEKRVTVGRLLGVGLFAFAWKKKKVNLCYYLIIKWKYKDFDYETIFEHTGQSGLYDFNNAKTKIVDYKAERDILLE